MMGRALAAFSTALLVFAAVLLVMNGAYAQARGCEDAQSFDVHNVTTPIEGTLVKTPGDVVFIRFTGLEVGEEAEITVSVKPSKRASITLGLLRGSGGTFASIDEKQVIVEPEGREITFRWHEGSSPVDLCVKILQFSETGELSTSYFVTALAREKSDADVGEAPSTPGKALDLGRLKAGEVKAFTGYLSGKKTGSDYVDYYLFLADIRERGEAVYVRVETNPEDAQVSFSILDSTASFALASNKTILGQATAKVVIEETGEKPLYIKISNEGGLGGDVEYAVSIKLLKSRGNETGVVVPNDRGLGVVLDEFTARVMLLAGVAAVALASVIAIIREARRRKWEEFGEVFIEEGW